MPICMLTIVCQHYLQLRKLTFKKSIQIHAILVMGARCQRQNETATKLNTAPQHKLREHCYTKPTIEQKFLQGQS